MWRTKTDNEYGMFRGSQVARVDDKGRLKLPVEYKRHLDERFRSNTFYVTSWDGRRARLYPMSEWETVEQDMVAISDFDVHKQRLLDVSSFYGQVVELDGQDRLTLPQVLRQRAKLEGSVTVLGKLTYLEVVHLESFETVLENDPLNVNDFAALAARKR